MQKLNVWALAFTAGIMFGVGTMFLGWLNPPQMTGLLSQFYPGYAPTFVGGIIGGMWAFPVWTLIGAIFASIYNSFVGEK